MAWGELLSLAWVPLHTGLGSLYSTLRIWVVWQLTKAQSNKTLMASLPVHFFAHMSTCMHGWHMSTPREDERDCRCLMMMFMCRTGVRSPGMPHTLFSFSFGTLH